jgi:urease accessory protein
MIFRRIAAISFFLALTAPAFAHTGHGAAGSFVQGFVHPLGGIDHVLAMVAVGFYAAMIAGRALWLLPPAFLGAMAFAGALGLGGTPLPYAEIGIAVSVIALGLAVASRVTVPALAAAALAGLFAIFHGHAHGAEMPLNLSGSEYAAGFLLATALLHGLGVALGLFGAQGRPRVAQVAGGAMALAGIALLASV